MSTVINSSNMNLPVPVVGAEPGPQYATDINNCLTLVDQHTHAPGYGVPINPDGININADLPLNGNNLTSARTLRLSPQSSAPATAADLGCLYEGGVDLFYIDGSGNNVRLTQNGSVAGASGTIGGLASPASASYVSANSTFVFQSGVNTPASIDGGSFIFRNITAGSNGITVSAPSALATNYSLTLPALPAQTNILTLDSSGNIASVLNVDNSTLQITSNQLSVLPGGITQAQLAPRSTGTGLGAVGVAASTGVYATSSTGYVNVTNQVGVSVTTAGRPVVIALLNDASGQENCFWQNQSGNQMFLRLVRNNTTVLSYAVCQGGRFPPPGVLFTDFVSAGTYTYELDARVDAGNAILQYMRLVVYEL